MLYSKNNVLMRVENLEDSRGPFDIAIALADADYLPGYLCMSTSDPHFDVDHIGQYVWGDGGGVR